MIIQVPGGRYYLRDGIRLIRNEKEGLVLQYSPLRVMRINLLALEILEKCRTGFSIPRDENNNKPDAWLFFLDAMYDAEIIDWTPSEDTYQPYVSIIVPVYNRARDIGECLESLLSLDYPLTKCEIIVVDDSSSDHTAAVVSSYENVRLMVQPKNLGQSAARNTGVKVARGEIIAFTDSDCIADRDWLNELLPYFQDPRLALIGGFVDTFFRQSGLDRYEEVRSPLNMGSRRIVGKGKRSIFYTPTCNSLIRKNVYLFSKGLDEDLRVGEDVDLCWRLMAMGYRLMYVPKGRISHKHRNRLYQGLRRRFDYGTSEAILYDKYRYISKQFAWHWEGIIVLILFLAGLAFRFVVLFLLLLLILSLEPVVKKWQLQHKFKVKIPVIKIAKAVLKQQLSFACQFGYHLSRYYLFPITIISLLIPQTALPFWGLITLPVVIEFFQKKPGLRFPFFALLFLMEQLFYQAGVFYGCLKQGSFRLYRVSFRRSSFING